MPILHPDKNLMLQFFAHENIKQGHSKAGCFSKIVRKISTASLPGPVCPDTEGPCLTHILGLGKNRVMYMKFLLVGLYCGPQLMR